MEDWDKSEERSTYERMNKIIIHVAFIRMVSRKQVVIALLFFASAAVRTSRY